LGDNTNRSSPVQVGSATNWLKVVAGKWHSYAIKTDGTIWSWGQNYKGATGLNEGGTNATSTPTKIGTLTNWLNVSAGEYTAYAIKTDGTLWAWGLGTSGQLGLSGTTNRSSPTQVGALTNWLSVAGGAYWAAAVKTNGTLWTWGYNPYGNLGLGNTTDRSSPVQVGALTSWTTIGAGSYNGAAIG
jgi:alpha-tubulin suppressor-like RCC1 family protein